MRECQVERSARVMQLEGLFDVAPSPTSRLEWDVDLPIEERDWQIGAILGPSGTGKSTIARDMFGGAIVEGYDWPEDGAVVDGFSRDIPIREVVRALTSVGFSSPPAWLRPFRVLSTGQQFRATLARALVDPRPLVVLDEYTSVVDRTVARVGSAAVAKAVRRTPGRRLIVVGCHLDVVDWLQPDWLYQPDSASFLWREVQRRPSIEVDITRAGRAAWALFRPHHYLTGSLHAASRCYVASVEGQPAAFVAVIHYPTSKGKSWRGHRTVCLPDFQGVGLGAKFPDAIAAMYVATGTPYHVTTGHPALIAYRSRSPLWRMTRAPARLTQKARHSTFLGAMSAHRHAATGSRYTASFRFVGPSDPDGARALGILC